MTELTIPFILRADEERKIKEKIDHCNLQSNNIIVSGDSGCGKTSLIKKILKEYVSNSEFYVIYLDLNADLLSTSSFFEIFLFNVWNPIVSNEDPLMSIGEKQSFKSFMTRKMWRKGAAKRLFQVVVESISAIPTYGSTLSTLLKGENSEKNENNNVIDMADNIGEYLSFVSKTKKIILSIDNYQFMQNNIKVLFETYLQRIKKNISFISIYRTDNIQLNLPLCFGNDRKSIELSKFKAEEILKLLDKMYISNTSNETIANDCYSKTSGNLKEIELYLKDNHKSIIEGTLSISKTRSMKQVLLLMPEIQRYLVLISAMFPAGLKIEYVSKILNDILVLNSDDLLLHELQKLIALGYIVVNSVNHDLLKPAHEKITLSLNKIANEDEFVEFYNSIKATLENLIAHKIHDKDYVYILHCVIGLYNSKQLLEKMDYLIDLIKIEYERCAYYYIVSIYKQTLDLIEHLPEICLRKILDSIQKTSEFSLGINLLNILKQKKPSIYNKYRIYEVKFLTQSYDFEMALEELTYIPSNNETLLYQLNILQHVGKDIEAQQLVRGILDAEDFDKWFYLILRNSAHYFSYDEAVYNLKRTLKFFINSGTLFERATVLNNLGVITIWNQEFSEAIYYLTEALNIHKTINSNEIFEVFCNLGVLEFLRRNLEGAKTYTNKALETVPQSLSLDHIILQLNRLIIDLNSKVIPLQVVYQEILQMYNNSIITKDPWVRFQVVYNLYSIELALNLSITEYPREYYIDKNLERNLTCFEIFVNVHLDGLDLPMSLSLSPNWRY
ncbi:tetratricopeptide repeat protein [Paenibacillus borealis]|uniref:Uncharacterized protein n=1 Tax=Paenibacillus borealis TaxID=160799 RepID=A0A089MND8_PAEBO|nr:tetratricopeptide repeat protein [Paenibacillus borealis]AIQ58039.1 hypothetical protein PBOR_14700 [Paenibacillus borealis]